eukprot:271985-Amphidinium_carterae.1
MVNIDQQAQQLQQLQLELQQQHQRVQQVETENARLRNESLGALLISSKYCLLKLATAFRHW